MFDLEWMLWPCAKPMFFTEIWQQHADIVATKRPGYFDQLFSTKSVENIIEFSQPRMPSIRLACAKREQQHDVPLASNGRIHIDQLRKHYRDGSTIIINSVEDYDPLVARLARSIETEMGARVQVNSYLTPKSAQGFHAHYDTHDVLVAQIHGEKQWKVYGGKSVCPLNLMANGDPRPCDMAASAPRLIRLVPGDLLYIPRGWIHEAVTDNAASLHLTFGIHPPLAKDLLSAALESLVGHHSILREALPVGPQGKGKTVELQKRFSELMELFVNHASALDAVQLIDGELLRRGRSGGDGHLFNDIDRLDALTLNSLLQRRITMACRVIQLADDDGGGVGLQFSNALIKGPESLRLAMEFVIARHEPFSVSTLPGLTPEQQIAFATSLVTDGLCHLADHTEVRVQAPTSQ